MNIKLNNDEKSILKKTFGLPYKHRNYFSPGFSDVVICEKLVEKGLLYRKNIRLFQYPIYCATQKASEVIKNI